MKYGVGSKHLNTADVLDMSITSQAMRQLNRFVREQRLG